MKYWILALLVAISTFNSTKTDAQINQSQLSSINVDELSDEQIYTYWEKAKSEGYSINEVSALAKAKGMSETQVMKLKQRILELRYVDTNSVDTNLDNAAKDRISDLEKFGLEGKEAKMNTKNQLFGYDFFSNPNISFTPNLNLATPVTYQIGPGDELLIDVWGAADNKYRKIVSREGAISIENIGPVYVSGLSIDKAKTKIISYLKKIYSGISASNHSYNKIYADVSLSGIRTVQVNIIGEVKAPGTYSLSALSTVLNALYASGGPTESGTFRNIKLIREGKPYKEFDIYKYLIEGSEEGNTLLRDQDVIIIQPYVSKIEVAGMVKRPGLYELKEGETITDLISFFSGFTSEAYNERLLIERVNGKEREVNEIVLKDNGKFVLKDGDKLTVDAVIDRFENRVRIEGAIYRPGDYELTKGLTLSKLLEKAAGVKDDAFLDRGVIYRTINDVTKEIVSFSIRNITENTSDLLLKREDSIIVFSDQNLKEKQVITIDGAINNPQKIKFIEKMRIEDLIVISGGFKEGADPETIDVSRRVADGNFEILSINIKKSSSNNLLIEENKDFYLKPFDRVSVRYMKGYTTQKNVKIEGEVHFPGSYSITNKDERISDLILKAGGFSPYAYLKGASLIRKIDQRNNQQLELLEELVEKDSLVKDNTFLTTFKIGIDLIKIMESNGLRSKYDLTLKEGDVLLIPAEKQTVEIRGQVLSPSLIRYDSSKSFKEYISNSGGFSDNARKRKSYVIYANGDTKSSKNYIFFKLYPKIEPGAIVYVPQKTQRDRMSVQEVLGITTGITTLGILINTLVK